jgi:ABC-type nitrate/sulfonate/bicarbonate transport system permease component
VALAWQAAATFGFVRPLFLPSLLDVIESYPRLVSDGPIIGPLMTSLYRAAMGFFIAMGAGVVLGIAMARSRWIDWLFSPLVAIAFPSPKVAFLPVFVLWFGIDHLSKIVLVAFTSIFPFIVAAKAGASTVPRVQIWAARAMGTSNAALMWRIVLPASLPSLLSGVRVAVPYALVSAFSAEMISGGTGLGSKLVYAQRYFESVTVFGILLTMLAVGYAIDHVVLKVRARLLRWD